MRITTTVAAATVALLAACGGSEQPGDGCMRAVDFQALVSSGVLAPRPAMRAGDLWAEPYLLRPTHAAPPDVNLYTTQGPYYVPGQRPAYVCD